MLKEINVVLLGIFLIGIVNAGQVCETYDDFSFGILNSSKWSENQFHAFPFTNEYFVDISEENYHVAQNIMGDAETNLEPNRQFTAGESFSYEVTYNSGSGNHLSQPLINGNYPPSQLENCDYISAGCGGIGYWNGETDLDRIEGIYQINFEFSSDEVKMTTVRPDDITVVNTFIGNSAPYIFEINTHTGHNGLMHFDYDNFEICENVPEPTLEERIIELENKVENLTMRVNYLENNTYETGNESEDLELRIEDLEVRTSWLEEMLGKVINFVTDGLPKGLAKRFAN